MHAFTGRHASHSIGNLLPLPHSMLPPADTTDEGNEGRKLGVQLNSLSEAYTKAYQPRCSLLSAYLEPSCATMGPTNAVLPALLAARDSPFI